MVNAFSFPVVQRALNTSKINYIGSNQTVVKTTKPSFIDCSSGTCVGHICVVVSLCNNSPSLNYWFEFSLNSGHRGRSLYARNSMPAPSSKLLCLCFGV